MKPTTFYLIRHGETDWNRAGRWQGLADVPLSMLGRAQAASLAQRLAHEGFTVDHTYSSDLLRAWDTAQIVAQRLGLAVQPLPALREIDVGAWSGLTRPEIVARWPGAFVTLHAAPDGENRDAFWQRVADAVLGLAEQHNKQRVLLVTHGGVIRALLGQICAWQTTPDAHIPPISNTSITEVQFHDGRWHIARISDAAHLGGDLVQDVMAPRNESMLPR
jgi:probable phosphoglycerate mutase